MAPTESTILANFLLLPSALPKLVPFRKFTDLFPRSQRSNPQVKDLYRELQHVRALHRDQVERNIAREVNQGQRQRREVIKARRHTGGGDVDRVAIHDMQIEAQFFNLMSNYPTQTPHTLPSLLSDMENACKDLQADIDAFEADIQTTLGDITSTVEDLSDLRYGRFGTSIVHQGNLQENVLEGLRGLEEICWSSSS